jgi:hypothetical protein
MIIDDHEYQQIRNEIKRLHRACRSKDALLKEAMSKLTFYKCTFTGKVVERIEFETELLTDKIQESIL